METPATPATPGVTTATPVATPPPAEHGENSTIRQMREQTEAANRRANEAEAKLKEIERSQMAEKDRLAAELADAQKMVSELSPLRDELGRYQSGVEAACAQAIQAVPEEKRAVIDALTKNVPIHERLAAIQQAIAAIGAAQPVRGGTVTQGGAGSILPPGMPESAKPLEAADLGKLSWGTAAKAHGQAQGALPDIKSMINEAVQTALAANK